jgi:nitrogen fixation protein FixH
MDTTVWRWFPAGLIAAMGLVFAVNGYMAYDAVTTFPGTAGQDGFDLSNNYDRVLATAQRQAGFGWQIEADVASTRYPMLRLADRNGTPLAADIDAYAERPLGSPDPTVLKFQPIGNGRFQASTTLFSGQWDIMLTIRADGRLYSATRRVIVK